MGEVCIYDRFVNQGDLNMDKSDKTHQIISVMMKMARHSMDYEHFEDAVINISTNRLKFQKVSLKDKPCALTRY